MDLREYCPACYMHLGTSLTSCACGWKMLDPMPRQDLELPPPVGFVLRAEHDRLIAEKDAEIERLRETAMPTDVLDEVERALVNAGVVLHRAQVTAKMDCINASVSDPLRKNIENWRARCVMAECDAGTALDRIRAAREGK